MAWNRPVILIDTGAAIGDSLLPLPQSRLNINRATAAELALLPAIGPALAQRIVEDRNAKGFFSSIEDLDRVAGIGKATIERLAPYATASSAGSTAEGALDAPATQPDRATEGF